MALVLADRVKETTTTTGTSDFALGGAVSGFQTFSAGVGNSNTTYYAIALGSDYEVGLGTLSSDGLTLARTTVLQSSNSDTKVSFAAGSKDIFVTYPADKSVLSDSTQTLTNKTLTAPIISSISNTGTLTLPTSTDTLVGRATTDTLTNKTLTSPTLTTPIASTTIGVGGATPSGSGSGITFPATQSASTDPNTLDDYEEGTWTPANSSTSYSAQSGFYIKVGLQVTIWGQLGITTLGGGSTQIISGNPFTPNASGVIAGGSVRTFTNLATNIITLMPYANPGNSSIYFNSTSSSSASASSNSAILGSSATVGFSITYYI